MTKGVADPWMPPGGKLRPGEGPREAVERELKEETGLDLATQTFAEQRIFLGGNRASHDPGRRNGGVMRNPNYTYADTRQPPPGDEGQQKSPHVSI